MQLINLGKAKFENIIKLNDTPIKSTEIDKAIINDYKEINDIVLNKKVVYQLENMYNILEFEIKNR